MRLLWRNVPPNTILHPHGWQAMDLALRIDGKLLEARSLAIFSMFVNVIRPKCYLNAAAVVLRHPRCVYCEGYIAVCGIPVEHAWVIDRRGCVVDPTLRDAGPEDKRVARRIRTPSGIRSLRNGFAVELRRAEQKGTVPGLPALRKGAAGLVCSLPERVRVGEGLLFLAAQPARRGGQSYNGTRGRRGPGRACCYATGTL